MNSSDKCFPIPPLLFKEEFPSLLFHNVSYLASLPVFHSSCHSFNSCPAFVSDQSSDRTVIIGLMLYFIPGEGGGGVNTPPKVGLGLDAKVGDDEHAGCAPLESQKRFKCHLVI